MWLLQRLRSATPGLVVHVRHHASTDSYGFYLSAAPAVWVSILHAFGHPPPMATSRPTDASLVPHIYPPPPKLKVHDARPNLHLRLKPQKPLSQMSFCHHIANLLKAFQCSLFEWKTIKRMVQLLFHCRPPALQQTDYHFATFVSKDCTNFITLFIVMKLKHELLLNTSLAGLYLIVIWLWDHKV